MSDETALVATEALRSKIRSYSQANRDSKRNYESDLLRFGLGEIKSKITELDNLTEKDVQGLANRIKRRKHATEEDMYRLSHAFLQGIENIRAFAKIPGALQTLVKELTGSNAEKQFYASEVFCNLSLGESPVCEKIATMAGSYLVTYLDSTEERLKRTALWTLANIMACGGKGARSMMSMEIVPKLLALHMSDEGEDDYREDAALVLDVIASSDDKLMRPEDLQTLFTNFHKKNPTTPSAEYHLKIVFNSGILSPGVCLSEEQVSYLINFCLANLTQTPDFEGIANRMRVLYAVRILANLLALDSKCFNVLIEKCTIWDTNLVQVLNKLFGLRNQHLGAEVLWLVKNIASCENQGLAASDFIAHLHIPCDSLLPLAAVS